MCHSVHLLVSLCVVAGTILACSEAPLPVAVRSNGGGSLVTAPGEPVDGISLAPATRVLSTPSIAPIGVPVVAGPARQTLASPATLSLPLDLVDLARHRAQPADVRILMADGGRVIPLPTRVIPGAGTVEADVQALTVYQAGVLSGDPCLVSETETCASRACALPAFLGGLPGVSTPAITQATAACSAATQGEYLAAVAALDQLLDLLAADLATGALSAAAYQSALDQVQGARTVLARVPLVDPTGTWLGYVPIADRVIPLVLQLHRQPDGRVLGYLPGTRGGMAVEAGWVGLDQVHMVLSLPDADEAGGMRLLQVDLAFRDDGLGAASLTGTIDDDGLMSPVNWTRTAEVLTEKRYLFFGPEGPDSPMHVSLVLTPQGSLVRGEFASTDCELVACSGLVTGHVAPSAHEVTLFLQSTGDQTDPPTGTLTATFDAGNLMYSGTWSAAQAGSPTSGGTLMGMKVNGTTTADAARVLALYARLADDLSRRRDFFQYVGAGSYAPIDPGYLHAGRNADGLFLDLATEVSLYDPLDVQFSGFGGLTTTSDPTVNPLVRAAPSVDFHDRRTGMAGTTHVYRDVDNLPPYDEFRYLAIDAGTGDIRITGNQAPASPIRLPFSDASLGALTSPGGFIPFGVLTAGARAPTRGFGFRFPAAAPPMVLAAASSDIVLAVPGDGPAGAFDLFASLASYGLETDGVLSASPGPDWATQALPFPVAVGTPLGLAAPAQDQVTPATSRTGFQTSTGFSTPFCPYWLLDPDQQIQVLQLRNAQPYREELAAPFVCNPLPRTATPRPVSVTWRRDGTRPTHSWNPEQVRFTQTIPAGTGGTSPVPAMEFDFLDADGRVLQHGVVTIQGQTAPPDPRWSLLLQPSFGIAAPGLARVEVWSPTGATLLFGADSQDPTRADVYLASTEQYPASDDEPPTLSNPCPDDGNTCVDRYLRIPGVCIVVPNHDLCSNGNMCQAPGQCYDSVCHPGPDIDCTDQDPCTNDFCIQYSGQCVHYAQDCDDSDVTTVDSCEATSGLCQHSLRPDLVPECTLATVQTACDDLNPNTEDFCSLGRCVHIGLPIGEPGTCDPAASGTLPDCNEEVLVAAGIDRSGCIARCSQASPQPPLGCQQQCQRALAALATGACWFQCAFPEAPANPDCLEPGNPGTQGCEQTCQVVASSVWTDDHCCSTDSDCNDFDACHSHQCIEGKCVFTRGSCVAIDACHQAVCDPTAGACSQQPVDCNDDNPCTIDSSCDPQAGCQRTTILGCGPEPLPDSATDVIDEVEGDLLSETDNPSETNDLPAGGCWSLSWIPNTQCSPGTQAPYSCASTSCGTDWPTQRAGNTGGPSLKGLALAVSESGSIVVARTLAPSPGSRVLSLQAFDSEGMVLGDPLPQGDVCLDTGRRTVAIQAVPDQEILLMATRPWNSSSESYTIEAVRMSLDPESTPSLTARNWNPDTATWAIPGGFHPRMAVDSNGLDTVAVYNHKCPDPEFMDANWPSIGFAVMSRNCFGEDYLLNSCTLRLRDETDGDVLGVWNNLLRVTALPAGRFASAWFWAGQTASPIIEYKVFSRDNVPPPNVAFSLDESTIVSACGDWCGSGTCPGLFPDPIGLGFALGTVEDGADGKIALAFTVKNGGLGDGWLLSLQLDQGGNILSCQPRHLSLIPEDLEFARLNGREVLFLGIGAPIGSSSDFAYIPVNPDDAVVGVSSFPLYTGLPSPVGYVSELLGDGFDPLVAVGSQRCCGTITQAGMMTDGTFRLVRFSAAWTP